MSNGTKYNKNVAHDIVHYRDTDDLSWSWIGNTLGIDRRTAKAWYEKYKKEDKASILEESPFSFERFKPLERSGDILITADWHIPLHDPKMVNNLLRVADAHDIPNVIVAGDFLHLDTFSHFLPHQAEASFDIERDYSTQLMSVLLQNFDSVDVIWGNHEHRISKFLDFKLSFEYCMKWILADLGSELDRINFSELDYMFYNFEDKVLRVCHPRNFSKIPLKVARELAMKYMTSVGTAHSHHCAQGVALDGQNLIFDLGGLFDKHKTEYVQKTSTHHEWVQGFLMIKDNVPTQFSPVYGNL